MSGSGDLASSLTQEEVATLARVAGVAIPAERLGVVTERLRDMYELAAVIGAYDLDGIEIDSRFDPTWPAEEGAAR